MYIKKLNTLTPEQIKSINASSLSEKHNCSVTYVLDVLSGKKKCESDLAKKIMKDGHDIAVLYKSKENN